VHCVLDVEQSHHADTERDVAGGGANLFEHLLAERVGRQDAGGVAGVNTGLLDVLHDAADPHLMAVAERVHVHLDSVLKEAVKEDRGTCPRLGCGGWRSGVATYLRVHVVGVGIAGGRLTTEIVGEPVGRVDDLHRAAAEHIGGAHEQRVADVLRLLERL
jgi:hypothetical protein